jgi:hypothetical protein
VIDQKTGLALGLHAQEKDPTFYVLKKTSKIGCLR